MTAVLGGDEAAVLAAIAEAGLTPANINAAGQIVAGGTLEQLAEFAANPPAGARLRPLRVAGAFHTKHMAPAVDALEAAAAGAAVNDPVDHAAVQPRRRGRHLRPGLGGPDRQPGRQPGPLGPVHGHHVRHRGHRDDRAASPGGTLTGMAKRALPGVELLAIKTPGPARRGQGADRGARDGDQRVRGELGRVGPRLEDRGRAGRRHGPFGQSGRDGQRATPAGATMVRAGDVLGPRRRPRRREAGDRAARRGGCGVAGRRRRPGQRGAAAGPSAADGTGEGEA